LPILESQAFIPTESEIELPPPDEVGEEEPDIRLRIAQEYRKSRARGASARSFSVKVLEAYHNRCAFCGRTLSGIDGIMSGIDAAHILAWSRYDLDVVQNGIALCKLHHWAFDNAVIAIVPEDGNYKTIFTELGFRIDIATRDSLGTHGFVIPTEWLPDDTSQWPSVTYIQRLYEDLEIAT